MEPGRRRISPAINYCIEEWNGSEWVPAYYCWDNNDAVLNLVLDRNEGVDVELDEETIDKSLRNMKTQIEQVQRRIGALEEARAV